MKKKLRNSLNTQMLRVTLIPLTLMAIIIISVGISGLYQLMSNETEDELIRDAKMAQYVLDEVYAGEYWAEDADGDGKIEMYKGDQRINGEYTMIDDLANLLEIDISLFYNDIRLITTLKDSKGNRATGTSASVIVKKDVLNGGESRFYNNVLVYDKKSYAFYSPIRSEDGNIEGMIAVSRSQESVKQELLQYIFPICVTCILTALLMGFVVVYFNRKLAVRISKMSKYINTLADGNFDNDIPREVMVEDDELKHLANDGRRMAKAIQTLVEYDALTGLNNRRYADKKLAEIRIRAVELGIKYCVCISDIDFFKKVNDTFGHEMGDEVLRRVAEKLKAGMVGKGIAARWGGEEFLLIFDGRELDIARRELELIMNEVRTIWVPDSDRQITMSFGLTALQPGEDIDDALKRADDNLYQAKEGGRNQIVCK